MVYAARPARTSPVSCMPTCLKLLLASAALAAGCAHEPAFRMQEPTSVDLGDRALAVVGDLQQTSWLPRLFRHRENNAAAQERLIADLAGHMDDIGALVIVGDLVFSARSDRQWDHFDDLIAPIAEQVPVLPAIGNHDYPCFFIELCRTSVIARGMHDRFPWFAPGVPYAVESGDLLLVFLDSESHYAEQGEWLGDRLQAAAGQYAAVFVFFHRPPYTYSIDRGAEGNPEVQQYIVPRLEAATVPVVVFNGHVHGLEYIVRDGVPYVTTAGGGGPRGPMGERGAFDHYSGPECSQPNGEIFRPFNYLLVREDEDGLRISIRGFCKGDAAIRELETIDIPF
jgi:Icc-related predicted phosphoesterase